MNKLSFVTILRSFQTGIYHGRCISGYHSGPVISFVALIVFALYFADISPTADDLFLPHLARDLIKPLTAK